MHCPFRGWLLACLAALHSPRPNPWVPALFAFVSPGIDQTKECQFFPHGNWDPVWSLGSSHIASLIRRHVSGRRRIVYFGFTRQKAGFPNRWCPQMEGFTRQKARKMWVLPNVRSRRHGPGNLQCACGAHMDHQERHVSFIFFGPTSTVVLTELENVVLMFKVFRWPTLAYFQGTPKNFTWGSGTSVDPLGLQPMWVCVKSCIGIPLHGDVPLLTCRGVPTPPPPFCVSRQLAQVVVVLELL